MGTADHTVFVEVTDPGNAQVIEIISGPNSLWRDIKTYGQYAYAVSEGGSGIQVMNMANIDLGIVQLVNTVDDQDIRHPQRRHTTPTAASSTEPVAATTVSASTTCPIPPTPTFVGEWQERYVHDAQVVTYDSGQWAARQIAFCCGGFNGGFGESGLCILDVTDKSNIVQLACMQHTNPNYSHQGWLTEIGSTSISTTNSTSRTPAFRPPPASSTWPISRIRSRSAPSQPAPSAPTTTSTSRATSSTKPTTAAASASSTPATRWPWSRVAPTTPGRRTTARVSMASGTSTPTSTAARSSVPTSSGSLRVEGRTSRV